MHRPVFPTLVDLFCKRKSSSNEFDRSLQWGRSSRRISSRDVDTPLFPTLVDLFSEKKSESTEFDLSLLCESPARVSSEDKHGPLTKCCFQTIVDSFLVNGSKSNDHILGYRRDSTEKTRSTRQIIEALRMGERSRASSLLLSLGHDNNALTADDFVSILKYCAKSPDPLFVMETWRVMEEKNIIPNNLCMEILVEALCRGGYLDEACNFIKTIEGRHGVDATLPVYNILLRGCAKMQSIIHANRCLDMMEHGMVGKNEMTYIELLKLAVWQHNLSAAHEIWKDYSKNYSFSLLTLRKFIWSFRQLRDFTSANETLQHMVMLAMKENIFTKITGRENMHTLRLDIPIPTLSELNSQKLSPFASGKVVVENFGSSAPAMEFLRYSFNDVIHVCSETQSLRLAEDLMVQMQSLGIQLSSYTYDRLIRTVVRKKGPRDAMKLLNIMEHEGLEPYDSTLTTVAVGCSRDLELDLAEALLGQVSEFPNALPFNMFFAACDKTDQPERALPVLAKMKHFKVRPDIMTYEHLFSLFGNVNAPYEEGNIFSQTISAKRINAIEMDMAKNGVQHNEMSMKNLLKALGAEGMIKELIQKLYTAEDFFLRNNIEWGTSIYNVVLYSLVASDESPRAMELYKNIRYSGFQPDAATYNIMIDCCGFLRSFKSACAIVSMMIRDGYEPQTLTYTCLIKILLKDGKFNEALHIFVQAIIKGTRLDVLLYNTILQKASEMLRIDIIEFVIEQMHKDKVRPDPSTCQYVFSAYVNSELENTAMEALQVLSMRMICEDDNGLEDKRAEYETNFILADDSEADSRIHELFGNSDDNLAAGLLYLRWCAIVGFDINWSPSQSLWARRLAVSFS